MITTCEYTLIPFFLHSFIKYIKYSLSPNLDLNLYETGWTKYSHGFNPLSSIQESVTTCSFGGLIFTPKYPVNFKKSASSIISSYGHPNNSTIAPFCPFELRVALSYLTFGIFQIKYSFSNLSWYNVSFLFFSTILTDTFNPSKYELFFLYINI